MPKNISIKVGLLKPSEVPEAGRIVRLAFGTFLGIPDPLTFMGDRDLMTPRFRSANVKVLAARDGGRLIGSNVLTRWGSFAFFGPLTVLPEFWDRGVAKLLLESTIATFDKWGIRHAGLFTFPQSPKHLGLYEKFGFWPRYLTAVMTRTPAVDPASQPILLSALDKKEREAAIEACSQLTNKIDPGLDLSGEIRAALAQGMGDIVLTHTGKNLDAFAVCLHGAGSEGGSKTCYIKFGAARPGAGAGERFDKLLEACDAFAASRSAGVEAGVNLAREDAFKRMLARGYRTSTHGVAMQRPHAEGFNRTGVYVIDDWR
jgi:GNAT superfamily N-acetyltransferase